MALRFGIVGCGVIHETHIQTIRGLGDRAVLAAVCDEIPERAQATGAKWDVPYFTDLPTMLADAQIDAVAVCVPSGLHAEMGVLAAKAGKHVVCEKPIDVSLEAADRLINACRQNGVKLTVISQHRYTQGMQYLKKAQDDGRLGSLCYAESFTKWYRTQEYYDSGGWRGTWKLDGGGALMNQGVHFADQLRWIMGPAKSVAATMATRAHERIEVEDVISATIEFESGAVGTLVASTALFPGYKQSLEVYGTRGTVTVDSGKVLHAQFASGDEAKSPGGVQASPPEIKDGVVQNQPSESANNSNSTTGLGAATAPGAADPRNISTQGHVAHYHDLLAAIAENREPFMNGQEARNALELVLAVYKAARTQTRVYLPLKD